MAFARKIMALPDLGGCSTLARTPMNLKVPPVASKGSVGPSVASKILTFLFQFALESIYRFAFNIVLIESVSSINDPS